MCLFSYKRRYMYRSFYHTILSLTIFLVALGTSCSTKQRDTQREVEQDFAIMRETLEKAAGRDLSAYFSIMDAPGVTTEEREALQFLFAYMNTGDLLNYPGEYYLDQVRASLRAKQEMPWGKDLPDHLFRHFVLPLRVNNEQLDTFRTAFYEELKARVEGLSMTEAALEVNHWCHEYVTYEPSDGRTRSPLATMKSALGRCGEESTFTTAALRAVGIPARQVYTPRWAHTDDNHAWVEVWTDGAWHFLGACEPAAKLDIAWFNSSVVRAMLVHTRAFGKYHGHEEELQSTNNYTEVNTIDTYTETADIHVEVVYADGSPAEGAEVEFCIYNYAEFCPVVTKTSDYDGRASLRAGLGDLFVWASQGDQCGWVIVKQAENKDKTWRITLRPASEQPERVDFRISPPDASPLPATVSPEEEQANNRRLAQEDSIRKAYEATFMTIDKATAWTKDHGYPAKPLADLLVASRGNHKALTVFLDKVPDDRYHAAVDLLRTLSVKDLQDTPEWLLTKIYRSMPEQYTDFELQYVLNPRIRTEHLTPHRAELQAFLDEKAPGKRAEVKDNPEKLLDLMYQYVSVCDDYSSQHIEMYPIASMRAGLTDSRNQEVLFVALARACDIPARINAVTGAVEYSSDMGKTWHVVNLHVGTTELPVQGSLSLSYTQESDAQIAHPKYYSHFSVAAITPEAKLRTLYYDEGGELELDKLFAMPKQHNAGFYYLISGTRLASGAVTGQMQRFEIKGGEEVRVQMTLPADADALKVIGSMNAEALYFDKAKSEAVSLLSTTGRGYFVLTLLDAGTEPTNHVLKDLERAKSALKSWTRPIMLLFRDATDLGAFHREEFPDLPNNVHVGYDMDQRLIKEILANIDEAKPLEYPMIVVADSFGRVVFISQGYTIGIGDRLATQILPSL